MSPEIFAKDEEMNVHVSSVHAIKCQFCPAKFMTKKDLDQHVNTDHKKSLVKIKCHLCPALFEDSPEAVLVFKKHLETKHNKIKCHFCPKKVAKGGDMNAHVASVHGMKCQFCPEKLTNKNMYHHIKVFHKNDLKIQKKI